MKQIIFITLFLLISCEENQSIQNIKDPNLYSIGFGCAGGFSRRGKTALMPHVKSLGISVF